MTQTPSTRLALERADFLCEFHLYKLHERVPIFSYREGYIGAYAGGHHVFRRNRVDTPETIISLCCECHCKAEHAVIKKITLVALLSKIVGVDLFHQYREICKWNDDDWSIAYGEVA